MTPSVVVVGGGLAGLSAACRLADRGLRVTLLEERARLGGATFSFSRNGMTVDNGQHVLLRCYQQYRSFVDRIGRSAGIRLQHHFDIPVRHADGRSGRLSRTPGLPAPLHLGPALARYGPLRPVDRLRVLPAAAALRFVDPDDPGTDEQSFGGWLARHGQNTETVAAVWDLITVAALNTCAENASLALAAKVFRTALLERADAADIGVPLVPLSELHVEPAAAYLRERGGEIRCRAAVRAVRPVDPGFEVVLADGRLPADAVVVAAPPEATAAILPLAARLESAGDTERGTDLGACPIVNVHVVYPARVTTFPFLAVIGSPVQWVFDRTAVSGVDGGQYLTVSVSAAEDWIDVPTPKLREVFAAELERLFPAAVPADITTFFVTRERKATFRQAPGTARLRPATRTSLPGLVLAGAWTATGWPDTMEGAVRSGLRAADVIADQAAMRRSESLT